MKSMTIGAAAVVAALAGTAGAQCEVNKWHHFQPGAGDHFGQVVSAWGNLAVVGAPQDDFNAATANAGSQFVYERVNGVWTWVFATTNTTTSTASDWFPVACRTANDPLVIASANPNTSSPWPCWRVRRDRPVTPNVSRRFAAVFPTAVISSAAKFASCAPTTELNIMKRTRYATVEAIPIMPKRTTCRISPGETPVETSPDVSRPSAVRT